ncbi:hypothetical protein GCM10008956_27820 [Deinococcus arenae]|uniref:Uncharacterized protein n=1 Tax=Deinococcus arenae TaxID=1452751 RepID=A0A8H9L9P9_9DEIO|nr:hypothetical protein [Deinococcus arenae]AWT36929.1 hypothetical protein DM785_16300 [Deinococcus actinosclerus]GGM50083.1 hypothetical protein GCM10008956_27820 [Deinococcus arenae]
MHREDQQTTSALLAFLAAYHQTLGAGSPGARRVGIPPGGHPQPACPLTRAAHHEGEALARAHLG